MPVTKTIRGQLHDLVLLEVLERDQLGRPSIVRIHGDDRAKIHIDGGEAFLTAFVNRDGMRPTVREGKA